jgi:hypothetical protein
MREMRDLRSAIGAKAISPIVIQKAGNVIDR